MQAIYAKARRIRVAIFDVDGVLTDGTLYFTDGGEEIKAFDSRDGHGIKMLRDSGVALAIISGRVSRAVEQRARNLGVEWLVQGADDKAKAYAGLLAQHALDSAATAYMGDEVLDLAVMERCGLSLTVPEAPFTVRRAADYVTRAQGGRGAVREACELIMHAQGTLGRQLAGDRA